MSNQINKASQKMYALTYKDGLVDLLIGSFFALLAFQEPLEQKGFAVWVGYLPAFVVMAVGLVVYAVVKRKVVMPRIGRAEISMRRNPARRNIFLYAVALQLVTLVIYILAATGKLGDVFPSRPGWLVDAFGLYKIAIVPAGGMTLLIIWMVIRTPIWNLKNEAFETKK